MASTDLDVLRVLHQSTGGADWNDNANWGTDADVWRWYGVEANAQGRVVKLDLNGNNLRGSILQRLGELGALTELKLWNNKLSGHILKELGALGKLQALLLTQNQLTAGPIPPELGNLKTLRYLHLGENQLSGYIPQELGDLHDLEDLYLYNNHLGGQIPKELGALAKLQRLWLHDNRLSGPIPKELGNLTELEQLCLDRNKLSGIISSDVSKMKKLKTFRVRRGNSALSLPQGARYPTTEFYKWMQRNDLVSDLASVPSHGSADTKIQGPSRPFPTKKHQGILLEAPISADAPDCLEFGDYADVLVERMTDPAAWPVGVGIYAQWGAGKSSLLQLILGKLKVEPPTSPKRWFTRWLWMTTGGSVICALWEGLSSAVCCRCCRSPAHDDQLNNAEKGLGAFSADKPDSVISVVASFDAWLFADSKVLWASLISEIFKQIKVWRKRPLAMMLLATQNKAARRVREHGCSDCHALFHATLIRECEQVEEHACFGKGAVRATRVRHAVTSSTCTDWFLVMFTAIVVAGVGAAAGLAGEQIANMQQELEQLVAAAALAAVPISLLLWIFKILPVVFKGQGELILRQAQSMGESVGITHLGFMADVQDELQVLLGMLERRSTKEHRYMLVVSIDNLDRCPHRQIVKVLEAVHLLLEKDKVNVAVILALDPRVIIAAIEEDMGEGMRREVSGAEYLDKIIHWPFCIPSGTETERLSLLHGWLPSQDSESPPDTLGTDDVDPDQPGEERPSQGDNDANPNREPIETSEEVQNSLSRPVEPRNATPPVGGHTEPLDSEDSSGAVSDGNDTESEEKETDAGTSTGVGTPGSSVGGDRAPFAAGGEAAPPLQRQTSNYAMHTKEEVEELEEMIKAIVTTPRKAKRIYNIYSIQRALARKRASKDNAYDFSRDSARKLLRWTILSEFWPFHTACLVAVVKNTKDTGTLFHLYETEGAEFLSDMLNGKRSSNADPDSMTDSNNPFRAEARRLMGFEEADEDFVRVLSFTPDLLVQDFDEDKLGLLRLSFNLNPAMVARVVAWKRSNW